MCGPAALPLAAAGMAAAGSLMGGVSALQQGNYESQVAKMNAGIATDAARDSEARGRQDALRFYRQVGATKGEQIAAMSANGIDVNSGTALTIQKDTAAGADEDAQNLYHNTYERTRGYLISATSDMGQAATAKAQGRAALIGSVFKAGSSLMSGFSQMGGLQAKMNPGGGGTWGPSVASSRFNPGSGPGFG